MSADNPWISDICSRNRLDYNILLNSDTAQEKGIEDGDIVCVESKTGKVKGTVAVTECIHPQVVGTLGDTSASGLNTRPSPGERVSTTTRWSPSTGTWWRRSAARSTHARR